MEPDHEDVRANEDPSTQEYWEAGITTECMSALKAGNVDQSQKECYHYSCKGHIKANCPEWRKSGAQPWKKRLGGEPKVFVQKNKKFMRKNYSTGGGSRQKVVCKSVH